MCSCNHIRLLYSGLTIYKVDSHKHLGSGCFAVLFSGSFSQWLVTRCLYVNVRDNSTPEILWKPSHLMCHRGWVAKTWCTCWSAWSSDYSNTFRWWRSGSLWVKELWVLFGLLTWAFSTVSPLKKFLTIWL